MAGNGRPAPRAVCGDPAAVRLDEAHQLVVATTQAWVEDTDSDAVWAGEYEGRWGLRMAQQCRDFTTIWFAVGERTVGYEAFLLPDPPHNRADAYRFCLSRNRTSWPAAISLDRQGDLIVSGRIPLDRLSTSARSTKPLVRCTKRSSSRSVHSSPSGSPGAKNPAEKLVDTRCAQHLVDYGGYVDNHGDSPTRGARRHATGPKRHQQRARARPRHGISRSQRTA